jgi:hypothetical protein
VGFPKRTHDPDARLDYPMDWSAWLSDDDVIVSATVVGVEGLVVESPVAFTETVVTPWVSFGPDPVMGQGYNMTYHIATAAGREDDRTVTLVCKER